jgi:hypothetical protein
VFCIANRSDTFLLAGAIRLEANREHWLPEVSALAAECEVVVIYLSANSQGLLAELDLLRRQNLMSKSLVVLGWRGFRQDAHPVGDFPIVVAAPPVSKLNQSAFGPVAGRSRFRRELSVGIEELITC